MRGLQNSPKSSAWDSRLRAHPSAKAYRAHRALWDKGTRRVSWDDDCGRLNRIVVVLAVLAAVFHWLGPWGGLA